MTARKSTAARRIADLDRMLAEGPDGSPMYANRLMRELADLQFAILTKQVPLTIDDLRSRVRRADEILPNVTRSLPR